MTRVHTFWCEPVTRVRRYLRRYAKGPCADRPGQFSYHDASVLLDVVEMPLDATLVQERGHVADDSNLWPRACTCGRAFETSDSRQLFHDRWYRRVDTGAEFSSRRKPVGAMWDAPWLKDFCAPTADGIHLCVETPGGEWHVDGRANNCTRPDDKTHHCWCRHGDPRTGMVHVDKVGETCAAGAGSIQAGPWHGFLHHGILSETG